VGAGEAGVPGGARRDAPWRGVASWRGPDAPEGREGAVRAAAKLGRRLGCSIT